MSEEGSAPLAGALYSPRQVVSATMLASPLAGAWLLAANFQRLGDRPARTRSLTWGILGTIAVFVIAWFLPDRFPRLLLPLIYGVIMHLAANRLQGPAFAAHLAAGGRRHSSWRVLGIGLLVLGILLLTAFAISVTLALLLPDDML
ncbi:hypothetical protein KF840_04220 [bacterium]|nr:hypothetical protein [bacterium]